MPRSRQKSFDQKLSPSPVRAVCTNNFRQVSRKLPPNQKIAEIAQMAEAAYDVLCHDPKVEYIRPGIVSSPPDHEPGARTEKSLRRGEERVVVCWPTSQQSLFFKYKGTDVELTLLIGQINSATIITLKDTETGQAQQNQSSLVAAAD